MNRFDSATATAQTFFQIPIIAMAAHQPEEISHLDTPPIYVTKPFLPPLEEVLPYLTEIWETRVLTNGGPFHQRLEQALCEYLGVDHLALFANGTLALVTALQALRISGEVITTPFSFVATAHALLWNGITPVFADIDPKTLNLDPERIEEAITPRTSAILPVHVYGRPCDVAAIQHIADRYGLQVIYDAAHAFGVEDDAGSVLRHGDMSVLSFHATKVFNTFEGGAIVCPDAKAKQRLDYLKNFGFADEVTVVAPGINGKMCELQAVLGLAQLNHIDKVIARRGEVDMRYRSALQHTPGIAFPSEPRCRKRNFSYFPIFVKPDYPLSRDALYSKLKANGYHGRRYFYPLISDFPMYRKLPSASHDNLPRARIAAEEVICLPIFDDLGADVQDRVIQVIKEV